MQTHAIPQAPKRITDIVNAKAAGAKVVVETRFEILPVDFQHGNSPFQAYIFLAKYFGQLDGESFEFRKCYARGCPNNLCTHVSQAVNIANRYLQRDYRTLHDAGIEMEDALFSLDDMVVKFERLKASDQPALTIPELIGLAKAIRDMRADVQLSFVPAVEHFAGQKNAQTFLSGEFVVKAGPVTYQCHRCFACYPTEKENEEKPLAVRVANARLEGIYQEFERVGIDCEKKYF